MIKRYITIIESMTEKELETTNVRLLQEPTRIERLARGSGCGILAVHQLIEAYKHYSKYATQALKAANLPKNLKNLKGDIPMNARQSSAMISNLQRSLPPQVLAQMGGAGGLQQMMKALQQSGGKMPF